MAAALVLPISGPYTGTWNAAPLGTLNDDGYDLRCTLQGQEVNETDAYGLTLVESIYRGMNWRCAFRGIEWNKAGLLDILQMFGQTGALGTFNPALASIGNRWTAFCQPLVLSAILSFPPTTPQSLTATNAGFAPNTQASMLMTSKVRELPIEMILIPYTSGGFNIAFSTT